jgi:hypothetical protein
MRHMFAPWIGIASGDPLLSHGPGSSPGQAFFGEVMFTSPDHAPLRQSNHRPAVRFRSG